MPFRVGMSDKELIGIRSGKGKALFQLVPLIHGCVALPV